jgi:anionic cell wall polymer biosynthesis LytR-Cps2A-Psr (LCP) family protein
MMAVISQCLESRSIDEIKEMISICFENIETNMDLTYILSYLTYVYDFNVENLESLQIPGESIYTNGVWVFEYDTQETKKMIEEELSNFNS